MQTESRQPSKSLHLLLVIGAAFLLGIVVYGLIALAFVYQRQYVEGQKWTFEDGTPVSSIRRISGTIDSINTVDRSITIQRPPIYDIAKTERQKIYIDNETTLLVERLVAEDGAIVGIDSIEETGFEALQPGLRVTATVTLIPGRNIVRGDLLIINPPF
jgi:hypothetical protein